MAEKQNNAAARSSPGAKVKRHNLYGIFCIKLWSSSSTGSCMLRETILGVVRGAFLYLSTSRGGERFRAGRGHGDGPGQLVWTVPRTAMPKGMNRRIL